ncbi:MULTISPECIES: restriction endonuclease [Streptomyces]|uniref:Restriction endonuclease n=1 Tax=Streptomyces sudanensis TaxID=436397 RepID=A0ABY4TJG0_9ACTN|nr:MULTISPECIES: restriction endonuclease [Streptomyces]MCP9959979.1 restriction endonuclease [Streptomyces sudanensis]MCP9988996.1 restriction endonuclease [Streptomyces sudanensis]URN18305.1 restriction endonuclease [Streptomyces sudanensis]
MAVAGRVSERGRGGAGWRDVVLAVGLVGAAVGGLTLLVRTVWGGSHGAFGPAVLVVAVVVLAALARRVAARPGRRPEPPYGAVPGAPEPVGPGAPPPARAVPGGPPGADAAVPVLDGDAVDHEQVDPQGFEHTVAALCVRDGCTRTEISGGPGDLGADVVATTPDGRRLVVQCKQYAADHPVGSQDLQRFGGTCFAVHGAEVAVVVTTSCFTGPAAEYAETLGIVCVDGDALAAWTDGRTPPPWESVPPAAP